MSIIEQILSLLLDLVIAAFTFLFEFLEQLVSGVPKRKKQFNAEFISSGSLLSSSSSGFCLNGKSSLSIKDSYQNALVIGGTGTGKSSIVLIPSLFRMTSSFIVHDPSGELFSKSSGYLKARGYEVKVLNFASQSVSAGYNPLARASTTSEIQKVASLLVRTSLGGEPKDPFWNTQATAVLTMLITILKTQPAEFQNLYNVRQLLNQLGGNPEAVDKLFSRYAGDVLFAEYKSFIAYDQKVVSGIIATCKAALQIFSDDSVATVTSFDTLDFQEFRDHPVALFIQNSVADQKYYSVLTSLFFEQFFAFILGRFPKKEEQDVFLLIDEASSLCLPTLPLAVANVRKHRAGIMLLLQDFAQLIHNYGRNDADAIKSNCFGKMYFTGQSHETTKELESLLGKYEYLGEKGEKVVRPLMTNDEIRTIKSNRAILICGNQKPILSRLRPFYKNRTFRSYSEIVPVGLESQVQSHVIPILELEHTKKDNAQA
ncbi:MAG: type IV secretory system conjugative DNA transfer family protein [Bacteroidota bacterium]